MIQFSDFPPDMQEASLGNVMTSLLLDAQWVRREAGDSGILAEMTKLSSCPEASSTPTIHFGGNDDILYIQKDLYIALNSPPVTIMTSL